MYQLFAVVCSVNVFDNGEFFNSERVDMVMLYGVADGNARLTCELWIERFPRRAIPCTRTFTVVQHLRDHGTFKPFKLTIVAVIGPKECCKLKNKFWNESKKSRTCSFTVCSAVYIKRARLGSTPRSKNASFEAR